MAVQVGTEVGAVSVPINAKKNEVESEENKYPFVPLAFIMASATFQGYKAHTLQ